MTGLFITPIVDILGSPYRIPNGTFISVAGLANFSDGRQLVDITRDLSWTVDQSNIVTVEPKDFEVKLTGQSLGVTTLTVDVSDPSQSAQTNVAVQQILTVTNAVLTELLISPSSLSLPKAINQQLSVAGVYSDNSILIDIPEVSWSVEDDRIARISEDGLLSTYLDGQTKVLVSLDLIQAEAELVVNDATVESLVVSPAEASIVEGSKIDYNATVTFSDGTEADYTEKVDW
ncbi:Ig-like domain-containing protein, partial [Oleiphilus sp. HI0066]|uniref:Ig-like domain-containing protein n=1 Tax=Oleiphilus sp. HI0066 TaxID=1822242 RepID=UPI0012E77970